MKTSTIAIAPLHSPIVHVIGYPGKRDAFDWFMFV